MGGRPGDPRAFGKLEGMARETVLTVPLSTPVRALYVGVMLAAVAFFLTLGLTAAVDPATSAARTVGPLIAAVGAVVAAVVFWRAGAVVALDGESVRLALRPLWRRRIPLGEIRDARPAAIRELPREWGAVGAADSERGTVVGIGGLTTAVRVDLHDGRSYSVTTRDAADAERAATAVRGAAGLDD
ncbi:uncharacterized protein MalAC0309_2526 [Microcella alkaliphila]|uniref:PH domain-containing protein n=2 Tax=Microcella alkaliphila TaxID=279828 RepID=A0A0U5BP80_9MICO|nr:uncharacterized protein MalAC0309_2526 [Microcella alkaliphila]